MKVNLSLRKRRLRNHQWCGRALGINRFRWKPATNLATRMLMRREMRRVEAAEIDGDALLAELSS